MYGTQELLSLPGLRTFELKDGKFESAGNSRIGALDENAIDNLIEIAKKIACDYEHGFGKTKDENACKECAFLHTVYGPCKGHCIENVSLIH